METYKLTVNGQQKEVTADPSTPLLWVLREELKMTGTKYGCGIAACGACTVHIGGQAARSCVLPVSLVNDRPIVTIEAMADDPVGRVRQRDPGHGDLRIHDGWNGHVPGHLEHRRKLRGHGVRKPDRRIRNDQAIVTSRFR